MATKRNRPIAAFFGLLKAKYSSWSNSFKPFFIQTNSWPIIDATGAIWNSSFTSFYPWPSSTSHSSSNWSPTISSEQANAAQVIWNPSQYQATQYSFFLDQSNPHFNHSLHWCADTGVTSHMTPQRDWFEEYTPHSIPIKVANGTVVQSAGIGSVRFIPVEVCCDKPL